VLEAVSSIKLAALIRSMQFRWLALIDLADALVHAGVSVALAKPAGVWALVGGILAGKSVYMLLSYVLAPHRPRVVLDATAARPLIEFGRWIFLVGVVSVASRFTLQGVVSRRLGAADLGLYFLAAKVAFLPSQIAGELVVAVAFPLFVQLRTDLRRAARAFRSILVGVTALVGPSCALLVALAPSLARDALGARWAGTAPLIQVLALVSVVGLLGDMTVPLLHGTGRPSKHLLLQSIQSSVLIVMVFVLTAYFGVVGAALAWIPAVAASQWLSAVYVLRLLPSPFAGLGSQIATIGLVSIVGAVLTWGMDSALAGLAGFVTALLLGAAFTVTTLWALDRRLRLGLAEDLLRMFPQIRARFRFLQTER
jgi:PST family polysaccharide transporter